MFLNGKGGYKGTEQYFKGQFLCLFNDPNGNLAKDAPIRAVVVQTTFKQLGNFMMGHAKIGGYDFSLSGCYGSDGLPMTLRRYFCGIKEVNGKKDVIYKEFTSEEKTALWEKMTPLPAELVAALANGNGWNDAGNEAPNMKKWALANLKQLSKRIV